MIRIVVVGRGGTGKTSFVALAARWLCEHGGWPLLLVDADPDQSLAEMVGADLAKAGVRTIAELLEETFIAGTGTTSGVAPSERIEGRIWEEGLYRGGLLRPRRARHQVGRGVLLPARRGPETGARAARPAVPLPSDRLAGRARAPQPADRGGGRPDRRPGRRLEEVVRPRGTGAAGRGRVRRPVRPVRRGRRVPGRPGDGGARVLDRDAVRRPDRGRSRRGRVHARGAIPLRPPRGQPRSRLGRRDPRAGPG